MPRIARIVAPGEPHHVTQRGVRRGRVFSSDADYAAYLKLMANACAEHDVAIWAWCLMPNHIHLLAVPERAESLANAVGRAHWRYTRMVNFRTRSRGYLFQGRFFSCVLEGDHAVACARYIEMNPVRAGLVQRPDRWRWSSARFHLGRKPDGLAKRGPLDEEIRDWRTFLRDAEVDAGALRRHTGSGWPLGSGSFLGWLGAELGREVRPRPRGLLRQGYGVLRSSGGAKEGGRPPRRRG